MTEQYQGVVVIIPTRNRAGLAMNALRSARSQPGCDAQVLVSDNSTDRQESRELSQFCAGLSDARVRYVKPPEPLSMTRHYDWAIRQALDLYDVNHFALLTDRMIFKTGELAGAARLASLFPDKVISYTHDRVIDYVSPVCLEQQLWTGKVFELRSDHLLLLSSQLVLHPALPRMMNCIVPRTVFESIHERYGNIFDSIAPDFNFCYRCLEMYDSIIYYDKAVLIHYALDRSNGESQARGIASKDHLDFIANLGQKRFNFAAPIPEIMTVGNAIVHEYCYVKSETNSPRFPDIDMEKYLENMAHQVEELENPELKSEMRDVLASHGWDGRGGLPPPPSPSIVSKLLSPRTVLRKLLWAVCGNTTRPLWSLVLPLGILPPSSNRFTFKTVEEALKFADRFPRRRYSTTEPLDFLRPVQVDVEGDRSLRERVRKPD